MKTLLVLSGVLLLCGLVLAQTLLGSKKTYVTDDIPRFWEAVDSLKNVNNHTDSLRLIQTLYLDRMSNEGKKFIDIREYTAAEYLRTLHKYPNYFKALRTKTDKITASQTLLDSTFKKLKTAIPDYETPTVCFAIGCFRGGGTTKKDVILMGSEIALADSTMDFSEFKGNLRTTLAAGINLVNLVAHESIHCQQHHARNRSLLSITLQEGAANFLPALILRQRMDVSKDKYAMVHECELWQEFKTEINSDNLDKWLFNTSTIKNRPPDLGYFMGMRICEAYYNKQPDKAKAITTLLDRSKYMAVMEQSGYNGNCAVK